MDFFCGHFPEHRTDHISRVVATKQRAIRSDIEHVESAEVGVCDFFRQSLSRARGRRWSTEAEKEVLRTGAANGDDSFEHRGNIHLHFYNSEDRLLGTLAVAVTTWPMVLNYGEHLRVLADDWPGGSFIPEAEGVALTPEVEDFFSDVSTKLLRPYRVNRD